PEFNCTRDRSITQKLTIEVLFKRRKRCGSAFVTERRPEFLDEIVVKLLSGAGIRRDFDRYCPIDHRHGCNLTLVFSADRLEVTIALGESVDLRRGEVEIGQAMQQALHFHPYEHFTGVG